MTRQFTAIIEREDDGYVALCPELDIASQGSTIEEARVNLREALELFLETASAEEIEERLREEVYVTRLEVAVGRLRVLSGHEACEILARHGFTEVRWRRSHIVMQRSSHPARSPLQYLTTTSCEGGLSVRSSVKAASIGQSSKRRPRGRSWELDGDSRTAARYKRP
jgi:predicted RNase H-like HicB family nuclease